jgi:hypothetical protein
MDKKYRLLTVFILILGGFIACKDEAIYTPDEKFVLQAYLYANEPVTDITIRYTVPLTVADTVVGDPVNNARVILYKNSKSYNLVSSSDSGSYSYQGTDLIIAAGDVFTIEATANGKTATGETSVPEAPSGVMLSNDTIQFPEVTVNQSGPPDFSKMQELMQMQRDVQLDVVWDNPKGLLHFVVIENAEENQVSIFPQPGGNFGQIRNRGAFRQISKPTRESSYQINFGDIQYWGKYIVKVYRVNQEYADLYDNLQQDSRDLNEPPTNIKNGQGIFSAFNSQNVYFEVVKK